MVEPLDKDQGFEGTPIYIPKFFPRFHTGMGRLLAGVGPLLHLLQDQGCHVSWLPALFFAETTFLCLVGVCSWWSHSMASAYFTHCSIVPGNQQGRMFLGSFARVEGRPQK